MTTMQQYLNRGLSAEQAERLFRLQPYHNAVDNNLPVRDWKQELPAIPPGASSDAVYGVMVDLPDAYQDASAARSYARRFGMGVDEWRTLLGEHYNR